VGAHPVAQRAWINQAGASEASVIEIVSVTAQNVIVTAACERRPQESGIISVANEKGFPLEFKFQRIVRLTRGVQLLQAEPDCAGSKVPVTKGVKHLKTAHMAAHGEVSQVPAVREHRNVVVAQGIQGSNKPRLPGMRVTNNPKLHKTTSPCSKNI